MRPFLWITKADFNFKDQWRIQRRSAGFVWCRLAALPGVAAHHGITGPRRWCGFRLSCCVVCCANYCISLAFSSLLFSPPWWSRQETHGRKLWDLQGVIKKGGDSSNEWFWGGDNAAHNAKGSAGCFITTPLIRCATATGISHKAIILAWWMKAQRKISEWICSSISIPSRVYPRPIWKRNLHGIILAFVAKDG